jgi:hypothetical protein
MSCEKETPYAGVVGILLSKCGFFFVIQSGRKLTVGGKFEVYVKKSLKIPKDK